LGELALFDLAKSSTPITRIFGVDAAWVDAPCGSKRIQLTADKSRVVYIAGGALYVHGVL
jgi:hypothetical protein